jgi:hypothetical protein
MSSEKLAMSKVIFRLPFFILHFSLFILLACQQPFMPPQPEDIPPGKGSFSLTITMADTDRTILPSAPSENDFTHYALKFTPASGGSSHSVNRDPARHIDSIYLDPGTYTLEVTAYLTGNKAAARGSITGLKINEGHNTTESITLRSISIEGQGSFSYTVTFPQGIASAMMEVNPLNPSGSTPAPVGLTSGITGTLGPLKSGYYNVVFTLVKNNGQKLVWRELLHIYSNLESVFVKAFADDDFYMTIYTVKFIFDNGNTPGEISIPGGIQHGAKVDRPDDPMRSAATTAGLYAGTPEAFDYIFTGWHRDGSPYNFNTLVTGDITLVAQWESPANAPVLIDYETVAANNVTAAVTYANDNPATYTLLIDKDVTASYQMLWTPNVDLTIIGIGSERTIQYNGPATGYQYLFYIKNPVSLTLGNNITLKGIECDQALVFLEGSGSNLTMKAGSKITGHTSSSGALSVINDSVFVMEGGEIIRNRSTSTWANTAGGVFLEGGTIRISGGTISGNFNAYAGNNNNPADVFVGRLVPSFTLSGNATIGTLVLEATKDVMESASITIDKAYDGTTSTLNLCSYKFDPNTVTIAETIDCWGDKVVIKGDGIYAPTANDISKFTLEKFICGTAENRSITDAGYYIGTTASELGRLLRTFPATLTNIDDIVPYLKQQSGGTAADNPANLPIQINVGIMTSADSNWQKILQAIADAGKFVDLDLSACTMDGTVFDPDTAYPTGKDKIVSITLPDTATSIAVSSDAWPYVFELFTALESVSGGPVLASISDTAFADCYSLKSVSMPGLTTIGNNAFANCSALTSVSMPLLTTIGEGGFVGCLSLASISLLRVTSIGKSAFNDCRSLNSVDLPAVEDIGIQAFRDCSNLERVTLSAELGFIGRNAFTSCSKLTTVICHAVTPPKWYKEDGNTSDSSTDPQYCFFNYTTRDSLSIYVPEDSVPDYKSNTDWSLFKDGIFKIEE